VHPSCTQQNERVTREPDAFNAPGDARTRVLPAQLQPTPPTASGEAPRTRRDARRDARRPQKPKRKRDRVKIAFFVVLGVLLAVLLAIGVYAVMLLNSFNQSETIADPFPEEENRPAAIEGAQTILLLGSDSRDPDAAASARADSIMVVHIPADRQTVQVMSIMRDNWVPIPGHGEAKINAAMAWGGVPLMVETIEGILDARIDHVAMIDFESFKGLTTALGGVTIDNPKTFTAISGQRFEQGTITLEGADALAFARERRAFATGDYQRAANQQLLVKGMISKLLSAETLSNPVRVKEVVDEVSPFLAMDAGLDAPYVLGMAMSATSLRASDVRFFTSPTLGTGTAAGQSIVKPDWDGLAEIGAAMKAGTLAAYVPTGK